MDSIESLILKHFQHLSPNRNQLVSIKKLVIGYMFRTYTSVMITNKIRHILNQPKLRVIDFRDELLGKGYLMKNVKLWIYHSLAYGYSKKTAKKFKVLDADFKLKKYVDANTRLSLYVMLEKGYTPKTLFEFDRIVDLNCESLTSWTGRFVGKKMAFIIRSQKIPATDLIAQLLSCGYASILHNYPKIESTEHLINLMKSQIRNRGINLIEFYATAKRSNLNREENGEFAAKIVSLDTTFVSKEVGSMAAEENQDAEILRLTIRRLISKYNGKRQIFIYLLMGYYHKDFSVYLKTVGINVPNDVYFDRLKDMDLYIRHALDYLGVAHSVGFKFVEKIKTALAA